MQTTHNLCFLCERPTHDTPLCASCNEDFLSFEQDNPELLTEPNDSDWLDRVREDLTVLD